MANQSEHFDAAVIGAGMAGLTAAIYCQRFKLATVVIARELGGVITETASVENWPGIASISGVELMDEVRKQAEGFGAALLYDEVTAIEGGAWDFTIVTAAGKRLAASAVVLALGSQRKKLGVPGEKEFTGRGVSYCATCDAFFFKGKTVAVIGGADSAAASAELLSTIAEKVYVVYRRDRLRAEPIRVERLEKAANVEILTTSVVESILGTDTVEACMLDGGRKLAADGVFVEIGFEPSTKLPNALGLGLDETGFIEVDEAGRTNVDGIYAAGDATTGTNRMRQLVTAAAEGAIAAGSLYEDLARRPMQY